LPNSESSSLTEISSISGLPLSAGFDDVDEGVPISGFDERFSSPESVLICVPTVCPAIFEGVSGEGASTVFEMEIGTNRPDAMNHYGVAREAAALYGLPLKANATGSAQDRPASCKKHGGDFEIDIGDKEGCARYTAQIVRGVKIKPSPEKIAGRLALVDQRAINNAADASNYTLWEMGHPTHAFDLDLLEGGQIVVRRARAGETLKTLDGIDRKLSPEDLIIADAKKPVALAGVMGGFDSMITEKTKNILIESAWFDPVAVRKTAKRHGLHTDASHRFERGADYGATPLACALVAQRIIESGGGELDGDPIDAVARELDQAPVVLRISRVHRILGGNIETHETVGILKRLASLTAPSSDDVARTTAKLTCCASSTRSSAELSSTTFDSSPARCRASVSDRENRHVLGAPTCAGPGSRRCSASW